MGLSTLLISGLPPTVRVLGDRQLFELTQNNTFFGIQGLFVPTLTTPSISNWEFKNNTFSGFRWSHVTDSTGGVGRLKLTFFLNDAPIGTDVLTFTATQTIFNLAAAFPYPVNPTDATTKQYVDERIPSGQISSLTGFVSGINPVSGILTTTRGSTCLLMNIPAGGNVDMGNFKLFNVATPTTANDVATMGFVLGRTWTTSQITDFISAVLAFRLDQLTAPTGSLNLNSQKIIALATPVASTDGANKGYVDTSPVTLIGSVSGTGVLASPITTTLNTRLDQVPLPTASVNLNSQKITNLSVPVASTDAANRGFVDNSTVSLIGDVSASGALSTSISVTITKTLNNLPAPTGSLSLNSQKVTNLATPVVSTDAATKGYVDTTTLTFTGDVTATGPLNAPVSVAITKKLNQLPAPIAALNLNSQQIQNLAAPTLGTDAANMSYAQTQSNITGTASQIAITGTNPKVISLIDTAVTPGTYTGVSQLIVDQQGRLTGISPLTVYQNLTFATALTWNWDSGNIANITLTGNTTLTIIPGSRQSGTLIVKQDAVGNRKITLVTGTYNPGSTNPDAGLSGPGNKVDKLFFSRDINGAIYYDSISKDMRQVT